MKRALYTILFGRPGWVLPGASFDADFVNGRYWNGRDVSPADFLSVTGGAGYAQSRAGLLVPFAGDRPRITDRGLLVEEARTNVVLWNRDLTNAAWTASNVTVAKNQTGADGSANSASSLTATAGNGTVLQAITLASSARFQSAYVKRLTGSGAIQMTTDNGATWTAITVTNSYTQLSIPTQTLANPTVGFRIVTNGDAIAVDFVQNENGIFATSPVATTTAPVTRAADIVTLIGSASSSAIAAHAARFETNFGEGITSSARLLEYTSKRMFYFDNVTVRISPDGTNGSQPTIGGGGNYFGLVKSAFGFDVAGTSAIANGSALATDGTAWPTPTGPVYLATNSAGNRALNGYMCRATLGLTKGQFDAMTM